MKATDLQIGDWVKINDVDYPNPAQVGGITKKHGTFYAHFPQWDLLVEDEKLEPIPITPEILEKNGFVGKMYACLTLDENSELEYYYYKHRLRKWWRGIDEWENHAEVKDITFQCQCYYIHELQHALRLCCIEKEIII